MKITSYRSRAITLRISLRFLIYFSNFWWKWLNSGFNSWFLINYSYDVTISKLNNSMTGGSHELIVGLNFWNVKQHEKFCFSHFILCISRLFSSIIFCILISYSSFCSSVKSNLVMYSSMRSFELPVLDRTWLDLGTFRLTCFSPFRIIFRSSWKISRRLSQVWDFPFILIEPSLF